MKKMFAVCCFLLISVFMFSACNSNELVIENNVETEQSKYIAWFNMESDEFISKLNELLEEDDIKLEQLKSDTKRMWTLNGETWQVLLKLEDDEGRENKIREIVCSTWSDSEERSKINAKIIEASISIFHPDLVDEITYATNLYGENQEREKYEDDLQKYPKLICGNCEYSALDDFSIKAHFEEREESSIPGVIKP